MKNLENAVRQRTFPQKEKKHLPEEDIKHFKRYCKKNFEKTDLYWGFTCFSRQNYRDEVPHKSEDEIIYGVYSHQGGCMAELCMTWERFDMTVPYLRSFSESFPLLTSPTHRKIFEGIHKLNDEYFSPDDFSRLLLSLGFQDNSDYLLDEIDGSSEVEQ